jgi:beta-glucosidase
VVQLYLRDPEASVPRPQKELVDFAKTDVLAPGESTTLRFRLAPRALSFYDPDRADWIAEPGGFELLAGSSSRDLRSRAHFTLKA